jgi:uncharacterized protein (TIGR00251 family)
MIPIPGSGPIRYVERMEVPSPIRRAPDGAMIHVWVVPGASRTEIKGIHNGALRVRVASPPADGAANRELVRYLRKRLGCQVELMAGAAARHKQILVDCGDLASIAAALGIASD